MLKFSYLYEDYDLAARALSLWIEGDARAALDWFRISANAVYAYRSPEGGSGILRLSPASQKRPENLRAEVDYLTWLGRQGYPAAQPIPSRGGAPVEMLLDKGEVWYASCFTTAPGERSDRIEWTDETAFSFGEALGKLHGLSRKYTPATRAWDWNAALEQAVSRLKRCAKSADAIDAVEKMRRALDSLPRDEANFGLLHGDFEPDNVFFDSGRASVIDFESGLYFFYAHDVRVALDSLEDAVPPEQLERARSSALRGYASVFPLDKALLDKEEISLFSDAIGLADLLDCLSDPPKPGEPDWAVELREKLSRAARAREGRLRKYINR